MGRQAHRATSPGLRSLGAPIVPAHPSFFLAGSWLATFVNGVPDSAAMRHVYTGDYIQPGNRRASPGVVPLGAVLMLCPAVQAFAWTFPVALDLAGFAATARARRLCLGSHHMEEGAARLFGPHHGDLVLRFGTGATPTSQAVDAAVARLAGFPRKLRFVATPAVWPPRGGICQCLSLPLDQYRPCTSSGTFVSFSGPACAPGH